MHVRTHARTHAGNVEVEGTLFAGNGWKLGGKHKHAMLIYNSVDTREAKHRARAGEKTEKENRRVVFHFLCTALQSIAQGDCLSFCSYLMHGTRARHNESK